MSRFLSRYLQSAPVVMDSGLATSSRPGMTGIRIVIPGRRASGEPGIHKHHWSRWPKVFAMIAFTLPFLTTVAHAAPETVYFKSADGATEIVGYLFRPAGAGAHPAIVLLHGRGGPYSLNADRDCTLVARNNPLALQREHALEAPCDVG